MLDIDKFFVTLRATYQFNDPIGWAFVIVQCRYVA